MAGTRQGSDAHPNIADGLPARLSAALRRPLYRIVWSDARRRARKLLQFAEVEADGSRDLVRAAELTRDSLLRRRLLAHAADEARHAGLFRARGLVLRAAHPSAVAHDGLLEWSVQGERGLDDLRVEDQGDASLLAFVHLSERAAARDLALCAESVKADPETQALFERILRDEQYHTSYTRAELERIAPGRSLRLLWQARLQRLWRSYLRLAMIVAGAIAGVILTLQYFVLLPPFALLAKRAARRERQGWQPTDASASPRLSSR